MFKSIVLNIISLISIFLHLTSCQVKDREQLKSALVSDSSIEISYIDEISLELDNKTQGWSLCSRVYTNPKTKADQIAFLNVLTNSIQVYDLSGEKLHEFFCEKEGPNGVGEVDAFLYAGLDHIFVLNTSTYRIYQISPEGKILHLFQLPLRNDKGYFSIPYYTPGTNMFLKENHLFIPTVPGFFYFKERSDYIDQGQLSIDLDLTSGNSVYQISHPNKQLMKNSNFTNQVLNPFCEINNSGERIYSFGCDHNVYIYNDDGNMNRSHSIKSKFAPEQLKGIRYWEWVNEPLQEAIHYMNNFYYEEVLYDKYRDIYYRIVKHGANPEMKANDFNLKTSAPNVRYSMIVTDRDFNILDEIYLSEKYVRGATLVTKEGILFQNFSHKSDEDHMYFDIYKVTQKSSK